MSRRGVPHLYIPNTSKSPTCGPGAAPDVELLALERSLVLHCFRLAGLERRLSKRIRRQPGGAALRQVERERQRLARELHTGVGQMLAAVRLQAEVVASQYKDPPPAVQQAIDRIARLAQDALEQVRAVSHRLHPPEWQRLTLGDAIRQLWDLSGIPEKFEAVLRIETPPQEPVLEIKTLAYRAVQEALSNLVRYAQATRVEVSLDYFGQRLILMVRDNGIGFDVAGRLAAQPSLATGIGLRSIREQAAAIGGNLRIESGPGGTTLELSAPIAIAL